MDVVAGSPQRGSLFGVPPLVLRVHGQEPQHHQVEEGADDGQAHQDVHEAESHVRGLLLQSLVLLQSHKVSKANSGQGYEAVVIGMEESPALEIREGCGADAQGAHAGQKAHQDHVLHGDMGCPHAQTLLDLLEQ